MSRRKHLPGNTMAMPASVKSPGAIAAIMGITMATCPCDIPVSMPMINDTAATMAGTGSGDF